MIRGMNDRPLKYKVNGHVPSLNGHTGYIVDDLCKTQSQVVLVHRLDV